MAGLIDPTAYIHPKAHVSDSHIGGGTKVWQFASIVRGAIIGSDCTVASCATVDGSVVGDRSIIGHNVSMGPGFKIGNDVFIGPNVVLCNDRFPRAHKDGFDISRYDGKHWAIIIEDGASIGAGAVVLPGVRIGKGAMVAAGAVCAKNLEAGYLLKRDGSYAPCKDGERIRFAS